MVYFSRLELSYGLIFDHVHIKESCAVPVYIESKTLIKYYER